MIEEFLLLLQNSINLLTLNIFLTVLSKIYTLSLLSTLLKTILISFLALCRKPELKLINVLEEFQTKH